MSPDASKASSAYLDIANGGTVPVVAGQTIMSTMMILMARTRFVSSAKWRAAATRSSSQLDANHLDRNGEYLVGEDRNEWR